MPEVTHGPIVGATTHDSVTIWLRADGPYKAQVRLAPDRESLRQDPPFCAEVQLDQYLDCTGAVTLGGLDPDTRYYYSVLLGEVQAFPDEGKFSHLSFRTFPEPDTACEDFTFAFGSCFRPHYDNGGDCVFKNLKPELGDAAPRFFLMIGDNVYVDDFYDRCLKSPLLAARQPLQELYYAAYRDSWDGKFTNFRRALMNTPTFMIFDDHEFWNNWRNEPDHQFDVDGSHAALKAYWAYQDSHNPQAGTRKDCDPQEYHYTFSYGDVGFFVLDCRTRRNPTAVPYRTMLGAKQREALIDWLVKNNDRFRLKFIISSVPVTFMALPHWFVNLVHGGLGDQWLGYPLERRALFSVIHEEKITGVHFLSGDIHLGQGALIRPKDKKASPVYSYTASPLSNTFYLIPEEAPAGASPLAGAALGSALGLPVARFSKLKWWQGIFSGGLIGAAVGELLRRVLNIWRPPDEHKKPGRIGEAFYGTVSQLVQKGYLGRLQDIANDAIAGHDEMLYKPENLFDPVFKRNIGMVNVRREDGEIKVRFSLIGEKGEDIEKESEAHIVR